MHTPDITEDDVITMREILFEKIKVAAGNTIGASTLRDMRVVTDLDRVTQQLYITLSTSVLTQKLCEDKYEVSDTQNVEVPKGAWQMFKRDHMPQWFVERFPVKARYIPVHFHKTIEITRRATYPKANMIVEGNKELVKIMGPMVIVDEVSGN